MFKEVVAVVVDDDNDDENSDVLFDEAIEYVLAGLVAGLADDDDKKNKSI